MQDQKLTPIPIPSKQRWNDFRVAWLPPLTFLGVVGLICWMWVNYVEPSAIIGEVETVRTDIVSTMAGTVRDLKADYLQTVTNGQELAVIELLDADQLNSEIAATEADLRLMKARMDIDKTRNLNAYSQTRVQWLEEKFNLDVARIRLQQAQVEFERAQKLLDSQLIARGLSGGDEFGYDVALRDRDVLQSEVATREQVVADLETSLEKLAASGIVQVDPVDSVVEQAIAAQREHIKQLQKPVVLRSPMDGFISEISCRQGEKIGAGAAVLVVSSLQTDRILAWVHAPVKQPPQVGDSVEVRRMGLGGFTFAGTVVRVGSQLEPVSPMLRTPTVNPERIEVGLPLLVQAPDALELFPGEAVQIRIVKQAGAGAAN